MYKILTVLNVRSLTMNFIIFLLQIVVSYVSTSGDLSMSKKYNQRLTMSKKYNEKDIVVRAAKKEDMAAVSKMLQELADFEEMSDGPKLSINDLERDGFDCQPPCFLCKVAEVISEPGRPLVGYALYFPTYSTWEGKAMMLEDLYVSPNARRQGVGERLFDAVVKEAVANGSSRLDFHVLEWNKARTFYERKGAQNLTQKEQWCYYRLSGDALTSLLSK